MTRTIAALLAALALLACEEPVVDGRQDLGEVQTSMSCTHASYCMTCLPGFDGKMDCGLKFSAMCPGTQPAIQRIERQFLHYKSQPAKRYVRDVAVSYRATGICS